MGPAIPSRMLVTGSFDTVLRVVLLVPFPPPLHGGTRFGEPLVLAAPAEDLPTDLDLGGEVEDHGVGSADGHPVTRLGPQLAQPILDADPVQPIGEVADGLGIAEVGLLDPALRLGPAYPPELALTVTVNSA